MIEKPTKEHEQSVFDTSRLGRYLPETGAGDWDIGIRIDLVSIENRNLSPIEIKKKCSLLDLPNGVPSAHSHPLGNRSVLLELFRKLSLDNKCLVG